MIDVTCRNCRQETRVPMYFSDARITTERYSTFDANEYRAIVTGKAICPHCGREINEIFNGLISRSDIIHFATKRNSGGDVNEMH